MSSTATVTGTHDDAPLLDADPDDISGSQQSRHRVVQCRRKLPFFVEPILVLYFFCEFPVDVINQRYTLDWLARHVFNVGNNTGSKNPSSTEPSVCWNSSASVQDDIQSVASWFAVFESVSWGLPALVSAILYSAASDRLGRRFAVIPPLIGALLSGTVSMIVIYFDAPIVWFLPRDLLYGCCGSFSTMTAACFSYIVDRTSTERRMLRLTVVQMAMLTAGVVSPIALGVLVDYISYACCMLIIVCMSTSNLIYVILFMPRDMESSAEREGVRTDISNESSATDGISDQDGYTEDDVGRRCPSTNIVHTDLHESRSEIHYSLNSNRNPLAVRDSDDASANIVPDNTSWQCFGCCTLLCDGVRRTTALFTVPLGRRRWKLNMLLSAFFISNLPTFSFSIQMLFEQNRPLCWSVSQVGYFTGVSLAICTIGGLITAPLLKRCLSDIIVAILSAVTCIITCVYRSFVKNTAMMYTSTLLNMFNVLTIPSIRAIMSGLVGDEEQGAVFGAIASVEVVCSVLGSIIFNSVYSTTLHFSSGFVFLVMAVFYAVGGSLLIFYAVASYRQRRLLGDSEDTPSRHESGLLADD